MLLNNFTVSLPSILCWFPALSVYVLFLAATVHVAQEEVPMKKWPSIILVSSIYLFCLVGSLYFVWHCEELIPIMNHIGRCLFITLVLYALSPISMIVSMIVLLIVHINKVGIDNI